MRVAILVPLLLCSLVASQPRLAAGQPDPLTSFGGLRIGVSPNNLVVDPAVQYEYSFFLRDASDQPVVGFPGALVELDFSACLEPSTRPTNLIPANGNSDSDGRVVWNTALTFGGSDPCAVDVLVSGIPFWVIPGDSPGGVRSPDENGDGVVNLPDLAQFYAAFVFGLPVYQGDLAQPFDDMVSLGDAITMREHFFPGVIPTGGPNVSTTLPLHVTPFSPSCAIPDPCPNVNTNITVAELQTVYLLARNYGDLAGLQTAFDLAGWQLAFAIWNCQMEQIVMLEPTGSGPTDGTLATVFDGVTGGSTQVIGTLNVIPLTSGCLTQVESSFPFGTHVLNGAGEVTPIPVVNRGSVCFGVDGHNACEPGNIPICDAGGVYAADVGANVTFDGTGSSDPDGTIVDYQWDFGDATSGAGSVTTHAYTASGTYTVTLCVTDNDAITVCCSTTAEINEFPDCDPMGPYSGVVGESIAFDGTGSSDADGTVVDYQWDFGDGGNAAGATPTHSYAARGLYTVTLCVTDDDGAQSCCSTTADVLEERPVIISIDDVGNDQGRQVRVVWARSDYDGPGQAYSITDYSLYRRQDAHRGSVATQSAEVEEHALLIEGWDYVLTVPARGDPIYQVVAPTVCDSTESSLCWSVFFVSALTPEPLVFFDSPPDSGYSIDNLAPMPPQNFQFDTPTVLVWDESEAADFDYFTLYGSWLEVLDEAAELLEYTVATTANVSGHVFPYYHLTATDFSGNEGLASTAVDETVGVGDPEQVPLAFGLYGVHPNPSRFGTVVRFDLPVESDVSLDVFDVTGRRIRGLVDGRLGAGTHSVAWNGVDSSNAPVPAGVYFYKLEAGDFRAVQRAIIMR